MGFGVTFRDDWVSQKVHSALKVIFKEKNVTCNL